MGHKRSASADVAQAEDDGEAGVAISGDDAGVPAFEETEIAFGWHVGVVQGTGNAQSNHESSDGGSKELREELHAGANGNASRQVCGQTLSGAKKMP